METTVLLSVASRYRKLSDGPQKCFKLTSMHSESSPSPSKRRVVLCADDYALTEGVSRGILELAGQGRITATSVMSNMAGWPALAPGLRAAGDRIAVGLHLNLTTGAPLGPMPGLAPHGRFPALGGLLLDAFRRRLRSKELREEIERQLAAFERSFGAPPAFVDGHQHVHVLPIVRSVLITVLSERGFAGRVWLRDPSDGIAAIAARATATRKALIVRALSIGFRRAARNAGFATNEGFSGFGPLDDTASPEKVLQAGFRQLGARPVVMCHPGYADETLRELDPAVESRPAELAYLASDAFLDLLRQRGVELAKSPA
jgi:chitin disaccharide deacetylase